MKTMRDMTRETFADLLDRRGANLAVWPAEERAAAESLLARDPAARAELAAAARLATLLARAAAPAPADAAFVGRVLARVHGERQPRQGVLRFTPRFAFTGATGLALCLVVGLALGLIAPVPVDDGLDDGDDIAVLVLGMDDGDGLPGDML
jgi:hypothetical protein